MKKRILAIVLAVCMASIMFAGGGSEPAAAPAPALDEESYAVLLAAISEEARLSGEEFRVTSIKEL